MSTTIPAGGTHRQTLRERVHGHPQANAAFNRDRSHVSAGVKVRQASGRPAGADYWRPISEKFNVLGVKLGMSLAGTCAEIVKAQMKEVGEMAGDASWCSFSRQYHFRSGVLRDSNEKTFARLIAAIDLVGELTDVMQLSAVSVSEFSRESLVAAVRYVAFSIPPE